MRRTQAAALVFFLLPVLLDAHAHPETPAIPTHPDPVVARVLEHIDDGPRPLILLAQRDRFEHDVWNRVRNLVAFRLHRPQRDGRTIVDAPIYLVRESRLYQDAAAALRNRSTVKDYIWCRLAAVIAHEQAHSATLTERAALLSEAEQLRRCLKAGHLHTSDGWSAGAYLMMVEARLRNPQEHY
jgi:hypothetical protein